MRLETYGQQSKIIKRYLNIRNRFRITQSEKTFCKFETYVPKLNKTRFVIGISAAIGLIITPFVTPLAIPCVEWALK